MAKFYITHEKRTFLTDARDKREAAAKYTDFWYARGIKLSGPAVVNETGFANNPLDFTFDTDQIVNLSVA